MINSFCEKCFHKGSYIENVEGIFCEKCGFVLTHSTLKNEEFKYIESNHHKINAVYLNSDNNKHLFNINGYNIRKKIREYIRVCSFEIYLSDKNVEYFVLKCLRYNRELNKKINYKAIVTTAYYIVAYRINPNICLISILKKMSVKRKTYLIYKKKLDNTKFFYNEKLLNEKNGKIYYEDNDNFDKKDNNKRFLIEKIIENFSEKFNKYILENHLNIPNKTYKKKVLNQNLSEKLVEKIQNKLLSNALNLINNEEIQIMELGKNPNIFYNSISILICEKFYKINLLNKKFCKMLDFNKESLSITTKKISNHILIILQPFLNFSKEILLKKINFSNLFEFIYNEENKNMLKNTISDKLEDFFEKQSTKNFNIKNLEWFKTNKTEFEKFFYKICKKIIVGNFLKKSNNDELIKLALKFINLCKFSNFFTSNFNKLKIENNY